MEELVLEELVDEGMLEGGALLVLGVQAVDGGGGEDLGSKVRVDVLLVRVCGVG